MSYYGTILQQGNFTGTGLPVTLNLVSDVDFLWVQNYTIYRNQVNAGGIEYFWQRFMVDPATGAADTTVKLFNAGSTAINAFTTVGLGVGGVNLVDTSGNPLGGSLAVTAISGANPPVVTTAAGATALFPTGSVGRLSSTVGALQVDGIDYTLTNVDNTHVALAFSSAIVAAAAPGATASITKILFDPIFYPRRRVITKARVSAANGANTTLTLSVTHGYLVGQEVRIQVPAIFGGWATAFNALAVKGQSGVQATIVAIGTADADGVTNTIDININTAGFPAFVFPLTAQVPFTPAEVVPLGEDTAFANSVPVNVLTDATVNTAFRGVILQPGLTSPGGRAADLMFWVAGKSANL